MGKNKSQRKMFKESERLRLRELEYADIPTLLKDCKCKYWPNLAPSYL